MAIGETILGAVLNVVFERLATQQVLDFFKSSKLDQSLVDELKHLMLAAGTLLADADQKQFTDDAVKKWLSNLQHLFYQAEDIANEIATEALRCSLDLSPQPMSLGNKIRNLFLTNISSSFANTINSKIREVVPQLKNMVDQSVALNLSAGSANTSSERVPTTCFLEDTEMFGRDQEKEEVFKLLQSEEAERNRIIVVAIVGMGGMGKTTLAKLIFNDESLKTFDLKIWVYVSEQFDISQVTKSILESITGKSYSDSHGLNYLQHELSLNLREKRFFLVLDDVWNESYQKWECLRAPLTVGAQGSKIIVTTRNGDVASIMRTSPLICLKPLADDDGWSMFSKHAFVVGHSSFNAHKEVLGKKIVGKCGGLPLAIKTLGGLLRFKEDIKDWEAIFQSNLWNLPANKSSVAPALRLSYHHLPSHLKRCFSYCAIFPKGYEFNKEKLVLLWMAENFVQPCDDERRIEDIGEEYLKQLLLQSFFNDMGNHLVMHDLMHDLAVDVYGEYVARLENGETASKVSEKALHFSFYTDVFDVSTKFESLSAIKYLRTFIALMHRSISTISLSRKIPDVIIPKFYCLYVLSLTNYASLKLPESIENLKQLRYLDVSESGIKELPESASTLCNLQTLLLSGCRNLERLPACLSRLVSLRHLDISETDRLGHMPMNMGKLNCLQTLSGFVVSNHSGQGIKELREMQQIRGKLALRRLQNVSSPIDALDANLSGKEYINELTLEFDCMDIEDSEKVKEVLENLKPHLNLERLTIEEYPGTRFPSWLNTHCSIYNKITNICLRGCKHCMCLPQLGQLPSLEWLEIVGMESIEAVGSEFYYAHDSGEMNPFPVLCSLVFKDMEMWKEWSGHEKEGRHAFPCLEKLRLINCPELKGYLPAKIRSLKEVEIEGCERLERSVLEAPSNSIEWSRNSVCKYTAVGMLSLHLTCLKLKGVKQLVSLPPEVGMMSCLETLELNELEKLESLENVRLPTNLKTLEIRVCKILECLPKEMELLNQLVKLSIDGCPSLKRGIEDTLPTSLQCLWVINCERWEFGIPVERMQCYSSLKWLYIDDIGGPLVSFPLGAFPNLMFLDLCHLRDLETVYMYISSGIGIGGGSDLMNLNSLQSLAILNCGKLKRIGKTEEEGVVDLPTPNLCNLEIVGCDSVKLWAGDREGLPSKLFSLYIDNLNRVLNSHRNPRSLLMFSSLTILEIYGHDSEYFPDKQLSLPISLKQLWLRDFGNLKKLNGEALKTLTSLHLLHIFNCPKLQSLPEEGLPPSLGYLHIDHCPLLIKRCDRDTGPDWPNICNIPCVKIDFKLI